MEATEKTYNERKCVIRNGLVVPVPDDEEDYHGTMMNARFDPETGKVVCTTLRGNGRKYTFDAGRVTAINVFPRVYY